MGVRARIASPLTAAVLLAGCGGGGTSSNGDAPGHAGAQTGTTASVDDGTPFACPAPTDQTPVTGADTLPTGATAALLCFHDNRSAWVPPRGQLRTGLDDLVRVVNAQPVHDPAADDACGGVGAPAWRIVLEYDGGTRTIGGDNGGCWDLVVGSTERTGAKVVWHTYLAALLRQRHRQGPGDHQFVPRVSCPAQRHDLASFSPLANAARFTAAVVCVIAGRNQHRITLSGAQLRTLRRDFATAPTRRTHLDGPSDCHVLSPRSASAIVGIDDWGDPFTVLTQCDTYRVLQPARSRYLFARMLPATGRMLSHLLAS